MSFVILAAFLLFVTSPVLIPLIITVGHAIAGSEKRIQPPQKAMHRRLLHPAMDPFVDGIAEAAEA